MGAESLKISDTEQCQSVEERYGIWYGSMLIDFHVIRRKRKSLEIAVLPDRRVEVTAPTDSTEEAIREKVKKRAAWIVKQQNWFKQFDPRTPSRQYLGGETHLYLGKKYRLKVMDGDRNSVRLIQGYFEVMIKGDITPEAVKLQLEMWYRKQSIKIFSTIFQNLCAEFGILDLPKLQIKTMKTRWGSLSKGGILTLNSNLIRAPKDCIQYVITHEICHIEHHNHSPEFYKLLASRMPDWERRKQKLEEALI